MVVSSKKLAYADRLKGLVQSYPEVLIVDADHVGSRQFAEIRLALRGKATIVMGKNTMIRTVLRQVSNESQTAEKLIPLVKLNTGMVFCEAPLSEVRDIIISKRVPAPARQGVVAPLPVTIKAGPTGLDPAQTSFFQALGISTKIVKSQVEIQQDIEFIKTGDRVSATQAVLLQKLNIRPFSYGLECLTVLDNGNTYAAKVLDITDEDVLGMFQSGVTQLAAVARYAGLPTQASVTYSLMEAFKMTAALCLDTDYVFPEMEKIKEFVTNPEAFAVVAPAAAAEETKAAATVEPEPEEEEEEEDLGFSLFD